MVNKGLIQIQGKYMKEWGNDEFPILIELINNPDMLHSNPTKNLNNFIEKLFPKTSTQQTTCQPTDTNSPKFHVMRSNLASLEADFGDFKQHTDKEIIELNSALTEKDKDIEIVKNEITVLKSKQLSDQQTLSDVLLKQSEIEDEMKKIHKKCKVLEENNSTLTGKLVTLKEIIESNDCEILSTPNTPNLDEPTSTPNIPTTNQFLAIADEPLTEETTSKPPLMQQQQSPQQETSQKIGGDTIILCDSNGRYLKPSLLCPGAKTKYIKCATLEAKEILDNATFNSPKPLIVHVGTNDLEHSNSTETLINNALDIVEDIKNKHPESHIIFSSLLPRTDALDEKVNDLNNKLEKELSSKKNITLVQHNNIYKNGQFKDKKHLNIGVKRFTQNLKWAFFRKNVTPPQSQTVQTSKTCNPMVSSQCNTTTIP
jgi:hypothetical protein